MDAPSPAPVPGNPPKLLDRLRAAIRLRHYSLRTEEAYVAWVRRFPVGLRPGESFDTLGFLGRAVEDLAWRGF